MTSRDDTIQKIKSYQPSDEGKELVRTTPIMFLVGISGAGKDTVKQRLLAEKASEYHHIVSHTTRQPRVNKGVPEHDGVEYHFIDWETAAQMVADSQFIEANMYAGNLYGTSMSEIATAKAQHKIAVTDVEVQGVENYKQISSDVKAVFLLPPSYAVWQERYRTRYGGEFSGNSDDIRRRMQTALIELNLALTDGYFSFVVNDKLEDTVATVDSIAHGQPADDTKRANELVHHLISELSREVIS